MLKKGNKVVMHTCDDAKVYNGKVWTCKSDEFVQGEKPFEQNLVFLEGFSGSFCTQYLQVVQEELNNNTLKETLMKLIIKHDLAVYEKEEERLEGFLKYTGFESLYDYYKAMTEQQLLKIYDDYYGIDKELNVLKEEKACKNEKINDTITKKIEVKTYLIGLILLLDGSITRQSIERESSKLSWELMCETAKLFPSTFYITDTMYGEKISLI